MHYVITPERKEVHLIILIQTLVRLAAHTGLPNPQGGGAYASPQKITD